MLPLDRTELRALALKNAVKVVVECSGGWESGHHAAERAVEIAEMFFAFLDKPDLVPARLTMTFGVPHSQDPTRKDPPMADFELPVGDAVTVTVEPDNKEGVAVGDTLTWTSSDPTNLAVTLDPTTLIATLTASATPTATVTVTASDTLGNSVSGVVDTVDGTPAALKMTFGTPFTPAPAPTPAP